MRVSGMMDAMYVVSISVSRCKEITERNKERVRERERRKVPVLRKKIKRAYSMKKKCLMREGRECSYIPAPNTGARIDAISLTGLTLPVH